MVMKTSYSYSFGSIDISQFQKDKTGTVKIGIKTPKANFTVRATKTGQVRFFDGQGNECELVPHSLIEKL